MTKCCSIIGLLLISAFADAAWLNTNTQERLSERPKRIDVAEIGPVFNPSDEHLLAAGVYVIHADTPCADGWNETHRAYSIVSNVAIETITCAEATNAPPFADPFAETASFISLAWPLLDDHPATNQIPPGGMTYRLTGPPMTWWIVRQNDQIAAQLSAHDEYGNEIIRTRDLRTGAERTIRVHELEQRIAPTGTLAGIRAELREIRSALASNRASVQAITPWTNGVTAAQQRQDFNTLRREVAQTIGEIQKLRRAFMRTLREIEE